MLIKSMHFPLLHRAFYAMSLSQTGDNNWYLDSGATNHMTADASTLSQRGDYYGNDQIIVGNGQALPIATVREY